MGWETPIKTEISRQCNNSQTRNSVTVTCNSVTEQNSLTANNQSIYYDQNCVPCKATSDTYQILAVIGSSFQTN